jgi:serine/threonine-protein kinase
MFVLHEGEKERRERIIFGATAASAPPAEPHAARPKGDSATSGSADRGSSSNSWGPLQTAGLVAGGAGLVGIGIGSVFGLMVASDKHNANCDPNGYCASGPLSDARNHATASTIGFVAGGVLLAAGVTLVIFGPRGATGSVRLAPAVAAGSGGVVLGGSFR